MHCKHYSNNLRTNYLENSTITLRYTEKYHDSDSKNSYTFSKSFLATLKSCLLICTLCYDEVFMELK